jgi:hypothetical protein
VGEWFSIEVFDGPFTARSWAEAHGDALTGAALAEGATDWSWHHHRWGLVLEIELPDEAAWERFRAAAPTRAALDAAPDPVMGLIVHRGRGGSSGVRWPRKPRPFRGSGAVSLPLPPPLDEELVGAGGPSRPAVLVH